MDVYIVYISIHNGNTERVADEIGSVLDAETVSLKNAEVEKVLKADVVGFGSGVYFSRFHRSLISMVKGLPDVDGKPAFLFSTSGMRKMPFMNGAHKHFRSLLESKGFTVIDEFDCRGFDTYSVLKVFGGINRGRPNENDIRDASNFAKSIIERVG